MIPLFHVTMAREAAHMVKEVLKSGYIAEGPRVAQFEQAFSAYIRRPAVAVSSCTAALHLALEMCDVWGGEVISTAMTAEPTNLAILYAGGTPVWADVEENGNISAKSISERITDDTRAIMVVHYGGVPCNLMDIGAIAKQHNIPVIEDAAHALGARYASVRIGEHSPYVCFSFQAIKHLPVGDGGMLVSPDTSRARSLRWFGMDRTAKRTELDIKELGWKYNMNDITAAIGLAQMEHIEEVIGKHIDNGRWFDEHLQGIPGLELVTWDKLAEPSYWLYTVLAERRDDLARMLTEKGIGNGMCHKRNDEHTIFAESKCELPGLDRFYSRMLHLPCHPGVTKENREYIAETIRGGW